MNNIDPSRIRWVKNAKKNDFNSWAYFDDYSATDQIFNLHWPQNKRGNASNPGKGDIILVFQNYKKEGARLTHLVEVIDDDFFIDPTIEDENQTARQVRLIHRTRRIINGQGFKYVFRSVFNGSEYSIRKLDITKEIEEIQKTVYDLFMGDWKSSFFLEKRNGSSFINIPPNKLFNENQLLRLNSNILTLIGENGCGKSAILEAIFKSSIYAEDHNFVCFSSGQNERFTKLFSELKPKIKQSIFKEENSIEGNDEYESPLRVFYFDKVWVKLIIALATSYFPEGRVRSFLVFKGYCKTNGDLDISTKFSFKFNISRELIRKIDFEREKEGEGLYSDFLHSRYFETIDRIRNKYFVDQTYENIVGKAGLLSIEAKDFQFIFGQEFELPINLFRIDQEKSTGVFLLKDSALFFSNFELNDLSDGEFQLLTIFALLDLFDSVNTFFLLDEIDSHLHYKNIRKLWRILSKQTKGNIITTSHIVDSIVCNNIDSLRFINSGKIDQGGKLYDLLERFDILTDGDEKKKIIASKVEYLALVEDKTDWIIFTELAKKKLGPKYEKEKIDRIHIVKCSGGYDKDGDDFGSSKKQWVKDFAKCSDISTKEIFLICDRDVLPIGNMIPLSDPKAIKFPQSQIEIIGSPKDNLPNYDSKNKYPHLLSWRRREIENYLFTNAVLTSFNLLEQISRKLGDDGIPLLDQTMDGNDSIRDRDLKPLLESLLYKQKDETSYDIGRWDYLKFHKVIDCIPASEVSDDIVNMYTFIVSKIN